ncbi:RICIN domain-containing protein [Streptococcus sobrinus]|uniref:RICIN domain-containing protein n=1 Tax=Streptococcus sobrinus TaxID=1310 RepID=UPI0002D6128A|nr:RICIN domain-containing protein [Streptococcus sobrinus]
MTRNKMKMRKHELRKQAYLAGLATVTVGALALSSGYVQADQQTAGTNLSDKVGLVTKQEASEVSDVQTSQEDVNAQTSSENQEQAQNSSDQAESPERAQSPSNQASPSEENVRQEEVNSEKVSETANEDGQSESKAGPKQAVSVKPGVGQKVSQDDENSTVKRTSVATVAERKTANTVSAARGDDYPAYLKNAAPDSVIDPWRLYNRECTSFTAWRLQSVNGFTIPGAYGNGGQWGYRARREGYRVDNNPAIGSVGWLDDGSYGHVAWISNVMGDNVEIEEYNYGYTHNYHRRVAHKSAFTGYIHFKDLATTTDVKRYNVGILAAQTDKTISDGDYHIVLAANPKYGVDVENGSSKNGTNVQLYQNTEKDSQIFSVGYLGNGYYKLIFKATGKALDVSKGSRDNKTNVQTWDYTGVSAQQWIIKQSDGSNTYEIISQNGGLALDVSNGIIANNNNLQMYSPNRTASQKFMFIAVDSDAKQTIEDGDYHIVSALDENLALDVENESQKDGANIQIYPNLANSKEIFTVKYLNNGYYSITHKYSGKMVDDNGNGAFNGNNISTITPNGSESQQWIIKASAVKGFFEIISKHKDKVLDVAGGIAKPRTNVQLYVRNGSKSQAWKFVPVKKD